jgi:hypothetical protein
MIEDKLKKYIDDPKDETLCFELGLEYEKLGQTSSAIGFYLRATEFTTNTELSYEALCRIGLCFERQGNRWFMIKGIYLRAISLIPNRPEANFLLCRAYERCKDWQEGYTYSITGKSLSTSKPNSITDLEYPGIESFDFQKGVCAWWIGLFQESLQIMRDVVSDKKLPQNYLQAAKNNLLNLNNVWSEPIIYTKDNYKKLRYKFNDSNTIEKNYSQSFQDLFVLMATNGLKNGKWIEIGCADPIYGNNTKLLEEFGWNGVSVDIDNRQKENWLIRNTIPIINDATKINWEELDLLKNNDIIDYLQIDIDPANTSYNVLLSIPFWKNKFRVITFEHDFYTREFDDIRDKSRKYLKSFGYELIVSNISPNNNNPYEDWWVHPELIDTKIIDNLKSIKEINYCEDWIYNR